MSQAKLCGRVEDLHSVSSLIRIRYGDFGSEYLLYLAPLYMDHTDPGIANSGMRI